MPKRAVYTCLALVIVTSLLAAPPRPGHAQGPQPCRGGIEVRWVDPPDSSDRRLLEEWCATVGPPVFLAAAGEPNPVNSLAIVSWNSRVGGGDLVELITSLRRGDLTEGQEVVDFVLLLQEGLRMGDAVPPIDTRAHVARRIYETPPSGFRLDAVQVANQLDLSIFYVPSMRNGPAREDRGNAVLSTFPLSDPAAIVLPYEAQRRVAAAVTISGVTPGGRAWDLRVCSAHLDVRSRSSRLFATFGRGRLRQAEALAAALPETPIVLGGDMNTWAPSFLEKAVPYLRERFPDPPDPDQSATRQLPAMRDRRLDHLMFRLAEGDSARYTRVDDRFASDHHPLLGWLRFGE